MRKKKFNADQFLFAFAIPEPEPFFRWEPGWYPWPNSNCPYELEDHCAYWRANGPHGAIVRSGWCPLDFAPGQNKHRAVIRDLSFNLVPDSIRWL